MSIPFIHSSLNDTLGAALLGNLAAAVLYGTTNVQTYIYFKHSQKDTRLLKCSIAVLWLLDSLHLALITRTVYTCAVSDFSDPKAWIVPSWSLKGHIIVTGFSDVIIRSLFCQRMWNLSKGNWWLTTTIAASAAAAFAGSIVFSIKSFLVVGDVFHLSQISWIMYMSLGAGVCTDCIVAIALCILLQRIRTRYSNTRSMVRTLMLYGINSGALTSLCEIACLVAYITMPDNLIFIALFFVLPKLGLNALLATLNARLDLRRTCQHNLSTSGQSMKPLLSPSIRYSSKTEPGSPRNFSGRYLSFQVQAETLPQLPRASRTAMHRVGYADADILEQGLWSPPTIFRSPRQSHFSDD